METHRSRGHPPTAGAGGLGLGDTHRARNRGHPPESGTPTDCGGRRPGNRGRRRNRGHPPESWTPTRVDTGIEDTHRLRGPRRPRNRGHPPESWTPADCEGRRARNRGHPPTCRPPIRGWKSWTPTRRHAEQTPDCMSRKSMSVIGRVTNRHGDTFRDSAAGVGDSHQSRGHPPESWTPTRVVDTHPPSCRVDSGLQISEFDVGYGTRYESPR